MYYDSVNYVKYKDLFSLPVIGSAYSNSRDYVEVTSTFFCDFKVVKYFQFFSPNAYIPESHRSPTEAQMICSLSCMSAESTYFGVEVDVGYNFLSQYKNFAMIKSPEFSLYYTGSDTTNFNHSNYLYSNGYSSRFGLVLPNRFRSPLAFKFSSDDADWQTFMGSPNILGGWSDMLNVFKGVVYELRNFNDLCLAYTESSLSYFSPMFEFDTFYIWYLIKLSSFESFPIKDRHFIDRFRCLISFPLFSTYILRSIYKFVEEFRDLFSHVSNIF